MSVIALEAFHRGRVDWSAQLRTIAGVTPDSTLVTSFQGNNEAEVPGKGKTTSRSQMVVSFTTPMGSEGAIPSEINEFIAALRLEKPLKRSSRLLISLECRPNRHRATVGIGHVQRRLLARSRAQGGHA